MNTAAAPDPVIAVNDLKVWFANRDGIMRAVDGMSFTLLRGETLGIVGESGCGKSVTAMTMLQLIPSPPSVVAGGSILYNGEDLLQFDEARMRKIRGNEISMIFQDPMTALNPVLTIGEQIAETAVLHRKLHRRAARELAVEMLHKVKIPEPKRRADEYPHQFSGGMRQRAMIAAALVCNPKVLIADEPTTALDVTIQGQILDLIHDLVRERSMALILISHDLGVIAQNAERMMVMYGGSVVESGSTRRVFGHMAHPYTRGLFGARPRLGAPAGTRLTTIDGTVPELVDLPTGCAFADRCGWAQPPCFTTRPPAEPVDTGHLASCLRLDAVLAQDAA